MKLFKTKLKPKSPTSYVKWLSNNRDNLDIMYAEYLEEELTRFQKTLKRKILKKIIVYNKFIQIQYEADKEDLFMGIEPYLIDV